MVRVNGHASVGKMMNVYPGVHPAGHVLNLYVEVPLSEAALWMTDDLLQIEADWKEELGKIMFASQQGLEEILQYCSVQGQFSAEFEVQQHEDLLAVDLASVGSLKPLLR
jgi:hypothetical protein